MGEAGAGLSVFDGHNAYGSRDRAGVLRTVLDRNRLQRRQARVWSDDVSGKKRAERRAAGASGLVGADAAATAMLGSEAAGELRGVAQAAGGLDAVPAEAALPAVSDC